MFAIYRVYRDGKFLIAIVDGWDRHSVMFSALKKTGDGDTYISEELTFEKVSEWFPDYDPFSHHLPM